MGLQKYRKGIRAKGEFSLANESDIEVNKNIENKDADLPKGKAVNGVSSEEQKKLYPYYYIELDIKTMKFQTGQSAHYLTEAEYAAWNSQFQPVQYPEGF